MMLLMSALLGGMALAAFVLNFRRDLASRRRRRDQINRIMSYGFRSRR